MRLTLAALLGGLIPLVGSAATAAPPTELADPAAAAAAARQFHTRVGVSAQRTETTEVFANPDGSFTAQIAARPVRVRQGGSWVAVDPKLRRNPDGSVGTVATPVSVRLSGGGGGPLVELERDGKGLALSWPGVLPTPVLDGQTATYPEVLPGVDLRVRAEADGFSDVLVVKNREAAANPALAKVRFGTVGKGLRLERDAAGSLRAVDQRGAEVFTAPAPAMWDSSTPGATASGKPAASRAAAAEPKVDKVPGRGRIATMPVEVTADSLVLVTDRDLLTGPDTVYPVFIDPSAGAAGAGWCLLGAYNSSWKDTKYWGGDSDHLGKVGYADDGSPGAKYRSIFQFDLSGYGGATLIRDAQFSVSSVNYAWNNPTPITLHTTNNIDVNTTWNNNAPSWGSSLGRGMRGPGSDWSGRSAPRPPPPRVASCRWACAPRPSGSTATGSRSTRRTRRSASPTTRCPGSLATSGSGVRTAPRSGSSAPRPRP
ncbi:hypothetical protein R8Z50_11410 [Longispora sp. K20-0274]|uniref:hypothetical protein n=1 Tax=Longispora sp. K20-0274 TaxID=3088255 RepID=UPI0039996C3E